MNPDQNQIIRALETEIQAIAIYEMEAKLFSLLSFTEKRRRVFLLINEILLEEKQHAFHLMKYLPGFKPSKLKFFFLIFSGLFLGLGFSILPLRIYLYFHIWAEQEASKVYAQTRTKLTQVNENLLKDLEHASSQESDHAKKFQNILNEFFPK